MVILILSKFCKFLRCKLTFPYEYRKVLLSIFYHQLLNGYKINLDKYNKNVKKNMTFLAQLFKKIRTLDPEILYKQSNFFVRKNK